MAITKKVRCSHPLTAACSLAAALLLGACADVEEPQDPAGELGDDEWSDEGPTAEDESSDVGEAVPPVDGLFAVAPRFQLPFPCNQVWAGQTRSNHSPVSSVDFNRSNDEGDTVVAAAAGTVTRVENLGNRSYGRWIEISHGNGFTTRYAHLASQSVARGQTVRQGQKIGTVGSTGGSTGPHLHYEQRHNGAAVRPSFNGVPALFYGTRNYTSKNACGSGGGGVAGRVNTAGAPLTVRAGASTSTQAIGSVADGTHVTIRCQKRGQSITGTYGTTTLWDDIGNGFVSDAYVSTGSDGQVAPTCP
ncbi:MAG TPA: peptidoglycan DD-metalloendopeptidase family protein [Kofleriaceae bacterium]|nr:peptidoglycan DD-metalloendopeptidase family protein [Kofleriaceae bacterium]